MKKHKKIIRFLLMAVVTALAVWCCEEPSQPVDNSVSVSVRTPEVENKKGSTFVSVKTDGAWTLNLTFGDSQKAWAKLSAISGKGEQNGIILSYEANPGESERVLTVNARCGDEVASATLKQAAYVPVQDNPGPETPENPGSDQPEDPEDTDPEEPQPEQPSSDPKWLELPAKDNPDLTYLSHSFKYNGKDYRNYSFAWSQKDLVSLWVAYPLSRFYMNGSVGRTDQWAYDPLLGDRSSLPQGGYGGRYDRGHLLMSSDRQVCYEANAQTFYGTNIAPQSNGHNTGIWFSLENKVKNLAQKADTAYVVSGVVVKGSKEYTYDSADKKMTVPVAFYKAVLIYDADSTIEKWMACGFYTEHKEYPSSTKHSSLAMSIDKLEKELGIDFFVNLEDKIGKDAYEAIESRSPTADKYRKYWFPEE